MRKIGRLIASFSLALLVLLNIRARLEFVGVSGDMTLDAVYGPMFSKTCQTAIFCS